MIEMMVTVIVVAVCLILVFRVFSQCAKAVSESNANVAALNILKSKMHELQEKAIFENGLDPSSYKEDITINNKKYEFVEEIVEWNESQEISEQEEDGEETAEEAINLREVDLKVSWRMARQTRTLSIGTLIPAKDYRHEF